MSIILSNVLSNLLSFILSKPLLFSLTFLMIFSCSFTFSNPLVQWFYCLAWSELFKKRKEKTLQVLTGVKFNFFYYYKYYCRVGLEYGFSWRDQLASLIELKLYDQVFKITQFLFAVRNLQRSVQGAYLESLGNLTISSFSLNSSLLSLSKPAQLCATSGSGQPFKFP